MLLISASWPTCQNGVRNRHKFCFVDMLKFWEITCGGLGEGRPPLNVDGGASYPLGYEINPKCYALKVVFKFFLWTK